MIDPSFRTLRRRSGELNVAADREQDEDTAALLMFYAAECALKAVYLDQHKLRDTSSANAYKRAARFFGHDLIGLIEELNIPANAVGKPPATKLRSNNSPLAVKTLHEAWRYGEKAERVNDFDTPGFVI